MRGKNTDFLLHESASGPTPLLFWPLSLPSSRSRDGSQAGLQGLILCQHLATGSAAKIHPGRVASLATQRVSMLDGKQRRRFNNSVLFLSQWAAKIFFGVDYTNQMKKNRKIM